MNSSTSPERVRALLVPIVAAVLALILIVIFRAPLVEWFTGRSLARFEGQPVAARAGPYAIEARLAPDPPREKQQTLVLTVRDASGKPVDRARVDVVYDMPAMGSMPEMKGGATVTGGDDGTYRARFDLPMGGTWALRATIKGDPGNASQTFQMTVGNGGLTAGAGGGDATSSTARSAGSAPVEYPPLAFDALRGAMDAYERARAKLAHDDLSVAADARTMADAFHAVHEALPLTRGDLLDTATAAREASEHLAAASGPLDARRQFAALSHSLAVLVAADARLTAGWHVFECPMFEGHPRWIQHSGRAENPYLGSQMPTCGSELSWQASAGGEPPAASSPRETDHYTCSMHPSVKQAVPGTCPICGMALVPVTKEQQQQGVVLLDEARRQLIGVRTEPVVQGPMRSTFRATGRVAYDESTLSDVSLKVHGWITKLYVNQTGQRVERGQTLLTIYSPELYNAEQDFLLATRRASAPGHAGTPQNQAPSPGASSGESAIDSAAAPGQGSGPSQPDLFRSASRQRLHLLGLTDGQIDAIARSGKPSEDLAIPAPASGFVIEKNVVEGASVDAGMRMFRIAGLNRVWIEVDVYEADLAQVRVGQPATITLDYLPGRAYPAKVAYVYPYLDPTARTGRVRLELANKELDLHPGMYANVELGADLGPRVQVPAAAVVYTGPRRLVFVDLGDGRFRPTEVQIGTEANGMYEVRSGVAPGDLVATSGVFLIAAEARISTAAKYWDPANDESDAGAALPSTDLVPSGRQP